jgi:hypothetical protein
LNAKKFIRLRIIVLLLSDCPVEISVPYYPLPSGFLEFLRSAVAVVGEVAVFDFSAIVLIHMVAMKAPADDLARFGFGASAFAMRQRRLALAAPLDKPAVIGLGSQRFRHAPFLLGCVLRTRTKLDSAIAVVVSFHQETTDALAVSDALPIVPSEIAVMTVAHLSPKLLTRLRPIASASHP